MNLKNPLLAEEAMFEQSAICQKKVAITIDDVPNTSRFEKDNYQSLLLNVLDSLKIPIAIFINEGSIYRTDAISENLDLLKNWACKEYVILGNHSFNHSRYSTSTFDSFANEIVNGERITRQLAKKNKKNLAHFRFPFNDLGKDFLQNLKIKEFLNEKGYKIAPYTIESSDWIYNFVYEHYLDNADFGKAKEIGKEYLAKSLEYFDFFESLAEKDYNRNINQIYLCHDNKLIADFLPKLITELKKRKYRFISLENALKDEVYQQKDKYFEKWGISWLYRWEATQRERIENINEEPSTKTIKELYYRILKGKE